MDLSDTNDWHCLAARRRAREITRRYDEALRPHGLRATQFSVLAALAQTGPMPLGELATPARRAFAGAGYSWIDQLDGADPEELVASHQIGPTAIEKLERSLADWNTGFGNGSA